LTLIDLKGLILAGISKKFRIISVPLLLLWIVSVKTFHKL